MIGTMDTTSWDYNNHAFLPAFVLPNLGFTAVLLLLIQHGFLFYDLLSTLPKVGGRQRRPL